MYLIVCNNYNGNNRNTNHTDNTDSHSNDSNSDNDINKNTHKIYRCRMCIYTHHICPYAYGVSSFVHKCWSVGSSPSHLRCGYDQLK